MNPFSSLTVSGTDSVYNITADNGRINSTNRTILANVGTKYPQLLVAN